MSNNYSNNQGGDRRKYSNPKSTNTSSNKLAKTTSDLDNETSTSFLRQSQIQSSDNLKVVIRIRPPLPREIEEDLPFRSIALSSNDRKNCSLAEYLGAEFEERERQKDWVNNPNLFQLHRFTFDFVFDLDATQLEVYENTAKSAVVSMLEGYNSTIFAYGQTGTGKTYTMEGFTFSSNDPNRGIIPRSIDEIFNYIESLSNSGTKFMVRASYLQIYNENISDLLKNDKTNLQIREDKKKGVFVEGLSEWAVRSPTDIYTLLQRGATNRATSSTKMNDVSSRSHAVFVITVEQMIIIDDGKDGCTKIKVGKLNLVDLAGSERIRVTGATGKQLEESKKINKSLSALGNVIYALTDTVSKTRTFIPYRDSKLTRLLEDSLGGNCKTTMMAMISPSHDSFSESLSTLHFARRAKNIKNRPHVNEDLDQKALIRQYEIELKKLRVELDEKNKMLSSNDLVVQLEEEKKQAENDKLLAIDALEQASRKYLQEREEKKALEAKIQIMNSQVLMGGQKIEDTPQFKNALAEKHSILIKEFDEKFQDFEKERQQIELDKAQVEKYKQLLLKQRDIMIALTNKLVERDEALGQFQEEVDAYDKICKDLENDIEIKTQRNNTLESILRRNNIKIPEEKAKDKLQSTYNKKFLEKVYVPYRMENIENIDTMPITLLSSEEKIKELTDIIKEKEKEVQVYKSISNKMSNRKDYTGSFVSNKKLDEVREVIRFKQDENNEEILNSKVHYLEKEIENLVDELEEKETNISKVKEEANEMKDHFSKLKENAHEKRILSIKLRNDFLNLIDRASKEGSVKNLQNEMIGLYNNLASLAEDEDNFSSSNPATTTNITLRSSSNSYNSYNTYNMKMNQSQAVVTNSMKREEPVMNSKSSSNNYYSGNVFGSPTREKLNAKNSNLNVNASVNVSSTNNAYKNIIPIEGEISKNRSTAQFDHISNPNKFVNPSKYIGNTADNERKSGTGNNTPSINELDMKRNRNAYQSQEQAKLETRYTDSSHTPRKYNFRKIEEITNSGGYNNNPNPSLGVNQVYTGQNNLNPSNIGTNKQAKQGSGSQNYFNKFVNK